MSADGASSWCGTLLSTCDDTDTGAGKPFSERRGRGSEAASTTGMPGRRWGERWGGTEDAFGFRRSKEDDLGPVFATPLLISCTPHFWIRKWRVGKEGLARVFAVRIQGYRTHFSNLARSCATAFDMVVYSRFADDDDTMLWLRFRARKRFRRQHLSIAQHRRWVAATGLCIGGGQGPCGRKRRELAHFSWEDHLLRLTEAEFKLRYRLNFDSFMPLH